MKDKMPDSACFPSRTHLLLSWKKVIVINGASKGKRKSRRAASHFAQVGAKVVINYLPNRNFAEEVVKHIGNN